MEFREISYEEFLLQFVAMFWFWLTMDLNNFLFTVYYVFIRAIMNRRYIKILDARDD
jgi:hypothetical protein